MGKSKPRVVTVDGKPATAGEVLTDATSVIRVGGGRGFIVDSNDPRIGKVVITAGHCLPFMPPCMNFSGPGEKTYGKLIGPIGKEPTICAECIFVDPISDLAILAAPDGQDLYDEHEAYERFVEPLVGFSVGNVPQTHLSSHKPEGHKGWVLSLKGEWQPCEMLHVGGPLLTPDAKVIKAGMSGSPILSASGEAVGVVASNYAQPRLLHHMPCWLLKGVLTSTVARLEKRGKVRQTEERVQ
jgi:hypothetical protein